MVKYSRSYYNLGYFVYVGHSYVRDIKSIDFRNNKTKTNTWHFLYSVKDTIGGKIYVWEQEL